MVLTGGATCSIFPIIITLWRDMTKIIYFIIILIKFMDRGQRIVQKATYTNTCSIYEVITQFKPYQDNISSGRIGMTAGGSFSENVHIDKAVLWRIFLLQRNDSSKFSPPPHWLRGVASRRSFVVVFIVKLI